MNEVVVKGGLTPEELEQILELARVCNEHDGIQLKLNVDMLRTRSKEQRNDYLYYEEGRLVGFLALYCFSPVEAELSGMVHPEHRRQGIFSRLLVLAKEELANRKVPKLIFMLSVGSESGKKFLDSLNAEYGFSEYRMKLDFDALPSLPQAGRIELVPATADDAAELARMTCEAFHLDEAFSRRITEEQLGDPGHRALFAVADGSRIGKLGILRIDELAMIIGFCVRPGLQGQGYGREILIRTLHELIRQGSTLIELEVAVENLGALGLYEACGFRRVTAYDYYHILIGT